MRDTDKSVGYVIAKEYLRDDSSKLLYCMEAVVTLMMQSRLINNPGTTPITILAVNSDHGLSFAREETQTMV